MMSISLIKLKNGIEVVGYLKKVNNNEVVLEEPMQIQYKHPDNQGLPVISFMKYCPFSSETIFQFDMDTVLHVTPVRKSAEQYYIQALDHYKNFFQKRLDKELEQASETGKPENEFMQSFLKKVKIDGYAH